MTPQEYRALRERLGWSQKRLAEAVGVSRETVVRREGGHPSYPIDREAELAILRVAEGETAA